jgi:hypothetical protein
MSLSSGCAESVMMPGMVIDMEEARLQTIAQVRAFLDGATEIAFRVAKAERYPRGRDKMGRIKGVGSLFNCSIKTYPTILLRATEPNGSNHLQWTPPSRH